MSAKWAMSGTVRMVDGGTPGAPCHAGRLNRSLLPPPPALDGGRPNAASFHAPNDAMVLSAARDAFVPPTDVTHTDDDGYTTDAASGFGANGTTLQLEFPTSPDATNQLVPAATPIARMNSNVGTR